MQACQADCNGHMEELSAVAEDMRVLVGDNRALTQENGHLEGALQAAEHRAEGAEARLEGLQRATACHAQELQKAQENERVCSFVLVTFCGGGGGGGGWLRVSWAACGCKNSQMKNDCWYICKDVTWFREELCREHVSDNKTGIEGR